MVDKKVSSQTNFVETGHNEFVVGHSVFAHFLGGTFLVIENVVVTTDLEVRRQN